MRVTRFLRFPGIGLLARLLQAEGSDSRLIHWSFPLRDRANLISFLIVLLLCLTVLAIAGAVSVAQGGTDKTAKKHSKTHLDAAAEAPLLMQLNAADNPEPDPSDSLGTGLLVLVVGLAAIWTFQARPEWRGRLRPAEPFGPKWIAATER
jgi:hypothetical protein